MVQKVTIGSEDTVKWTLDERIKLAKDLTELKEIMIRVEGRMKSADEKIDRNLNEVKKNYESQKKTCLEEFSLARQQRQSTATRIKVHEGVIAAFVVVAGLIMAFLRLISSGE